MSRILIIEDDVSMRLALRHALERRGHQVAEAGDGRAGLAIYEKTVFDLVVTDIIMPGMEGLETVMALRKFSPHLKIIAMSAGGKGSADDYLELAARFGANRTVRKPFEVDQFMTAVEDVLKDSSREGTKPAKV
jgi:DNA-binding NtrC family response regulator